MWADRVWVRWNLQGSAGVRGPLITGSGPSVVRSNSSPELGPQTPISDSWAGRVGIKNHSSASSQSPTEGYCLASLLPFLLQRIKTIPLGTPTNRDMY